MTLQIVDRRHFLRTDAEEHVRTIFRCVYGARIAAFPELLAVLADERDVPSCVAGVRFGLDQCFSEQYLDEPIDAALSRIGHGPVDRGEILEVTTLASNGPLEALRLVRLVTERGRDMGMRWGVFTATRKLRGVLPRLSLPLVPLAPARRERVANPADWGSYYETDPWVCVMADRVAPGRGAATAGLALAG